MKKLSKFYLLAIVLLSSIACGSTTRTVQYVYVDGPEYASESAQIMAINKSKEPEALVSKPAPTKSYSAPSVPQNPRTRLRKLAEEKGHYRGYGTYTSEDEDFAIEMATLNALQKMAERTVISIQTSADKVTTGANSKATRQGASKIKKHIADYEISKWFVVDSYVSDGPMYEAIYCVEADYDQIVQDLQPYCREMDPEDQAKFIKFLKEAEL